jgi:DNA-binding transcriptional LysR family regulator
MDTRNTPSNGPAAISLEALRALDAIQRNGSFAAAADELYKVPSALSYTIQKLEQTLGVTLFDRSGHRAELTPAGRLVWEQGQRILKAADELTVAARRVAKGWETRLRIAVDTLLPQESLFPLIHELRQAGIGTEIQLLEEVLGGSLDALLCDRADLVVGASQLPSASHYQARLAGYIEFDFVVPPGHPLAALPPPLTPEQIMQYPAVVAADSSRHTTPLNSGLLDGQTRLTVPNMAAKLRAHAAGLGVGFVPRHLAAPYVADGQLHVLPVARPKPISAVYFLWRKNNQGKALHWFLRKLDESRVVERALGAGIDNRRTAVNTS